jgi:hypothetical protein
MGHAFETKRKAQTAKLKVGYYHLPMLDFADCGSATGTAVRHALNG